MSVWTARVFRARVQTFVVSARFAATAVVVCVTAEEAHVVFAYVAEEAVVVHTAGEDAIPAKAFLVKSAIVVYFALRHARVFFTDSVGAAIRFGRT